MESSVVIGFVVTVMGTLWDCGQVQTGLVIPYLEMTNVPGSDWVTQMPAVAGCSV